MGAALLSDPDKIEAVSADKHSQSSLFLNEIATISLNVSGTFE